MRVLLEDFEVDSRLRGGPVQCRFLRLTPAIATRGRDTMDCFFQVGGEKIVVAVSHAGVADFRERTGKSLNDQQLVEIAAHFLKRALEAGESGSVPLFLNGESLMKLAREFGPL